MNYAEFWILETGVIGTIRLCLIGLPDDLLRRQWNKPSHGLNRTELVGTLLRLSHAGDIECTIADRRIKPSRGQLLASLVYVPPGQRPPKRMICYELTRRGGQHWEEYAKPDWKRYFVDDTWDGQTVRITAATSERLDEILEWGPRYWNVTFSGGEGDRTILKPWRALHWKTLPEGHRVTLRYTEEPPKCQFEPRPREFAREFRELRSWYTPFPAPS
jgi:hypothetical protein